MPRRSALCVGVLLLVACGGAIPPPPTHPIRIVAGPAGEPYNRLAEAVAASVNRRLREVSVSVNPRAAAQRSAANLKALEDGTEDMTMARADVVYSAFSAGTALSPVPLKQLRAVAVIHRSVLHVVVPSTSRVMSLRELNGSRVSYGVFTANGDARNRYSELLGVAFGDRDHPPAGEEVAYDAVVDAVSEGRSEVGVLLTAFPLPQLRALAGEQPVRFLDVESEVARRIRARFPFYKPTQIPANTYPGQADPITTVGVDNLLVSRAGLDEELVYAFTRAMFESLPDVSVHLETAGQISFDLAPTSPIPLHPGAARYFRERELLR